MSDETPKYIGIGKTKTSKNNKKYFKISFSRDDIATLADICNEHPGLNWVSLFVNKRDVPQRDVTHYLVLDKFELQRNLDNAGEAREPVPEEDSDEPPF